LRKPHGLKPILPFRLILLDFENIFENLLAKLGGANYIRQGLQSTKLKVIVIIMAKNYNLSASLEDYLEAILNLVRESSFARSRDIAKSLGVSRASVTGALRMCILSSSLPIAVTMDSIGRMNFRNSVRTVDSMFRYAR